MQSAVLLACLVESLNALALGIFLPSRRVHKAPVTESVLGLAQTVNGPSRSAISPIAECEGIDCVKQYVALPDPVFSWYDTHRRVFGRDNHSGVHWTAYVLNMTSQRWITENVVQFPVWWHTVVVVVPMNLEVADWATIHVEFGKQTMDGLDFIINHSPVERGFNHTIEINSSSLDSMLPELASALWSSASVATRTRTMAVSLFNALNQYQEFAEDPERLLRVEDEIKAYTWLDFMTHGAKEPERIMELPVAKSVVRAMDVVSAFTAALPSGRVSRFGIHGHSKLGMAAWMTGAIDPRVKAIAPTTMVMGMDSWEPERGSAFLQQPEDNPYDILSGWHGTEEMIKLHKIVSPLNWLDRLTLPKLVVMDTNDVWMDDAIPDVKMWWPRLPEPKNLLFVEAEHDTATIVAMPSIVSFFQGVIDGIPMPSIDYSFALGAIHVHQRSDHVPSSVNLLYADSCSGAFPNPHFLDSNWGELPLWQMPSNAEMMHMEDSSARQWTANLFAVHPALSLGSFWPSFRERCSRGAFMSAEYQWPHRDGQFVLTTPVFLVPLQVKQ